MNRILIVGAPRSGTTWLAATLAATAGSSLANEPDNQAFNPAAIQSRVVYGGYPVLIPGQRAPEYECLWDPVFLAEQPSLMARWLHTLRTGRRNHTVRPTSIIAKSVFAAFAVDWLVARYAPRVVLIERNPLDVVSSWMRLDFVVGDLATRAPIRSAYVEPLGLPAWDPAAPRLLQVAWAVGVLMSAMRHQSRSRPDWTVVSHATLSDDRSTVRALATSLGLHWSDQAEFASRQPAEPQDYAQDERGILTEYLSQFPELASWRAVESSV